MIFNIFKGRNLFRDTKKIEEKMSCTVINYISFYKKNQLNYLKAKFYPASQPPFFLDNSYCPPRNIIKNIHGPFNI